MPPVTPICAHWMPAGEEAPQHPTVWFTQSDSVPPMFAYWACIISRSSSVSSEFAGVGTVAEATLYDAWPTLVGPVKVEPLPE